MPVLYGRNRSITSSSAWVACYINLNCFDAQVKIRWKNVPSDDSFLMASESVALWQCWCWQNKDSRQIKYIASITFPTSFPYKNVFFFVVHLISMSTIACMVAYNIRYAIHTSFSAQPLYYRVCFSLHEGCRWVAEKSLRYFFPQPFLTAVTRHPS